MKFDIINEKTIEFIITFEELIKKNISAKDVVTVNIKFSRFLQEIEKIAYKELKLETKEVTFEIKMEGIKEGLDIVIKVEEKNSTERTIYEWFEFEYFNHLVKMIETEFFNMPSSLLKREKGNYVIEIKARNIPEQADLPFYEFCTKLSVKPRNTEILIKENALQKLKQVFI